MIRGLHLILTAVTDRDVTIASNSFIPRMRDSDLGVNELHASPR
jgi:hypothetical protein